MYLKWFFKYRILKPLRLLEDIYWWIRYRTVNKMHVIKIKTLKPGYHELEERLIHASFTLLTNFIEKEKPFEFINWDDDDVYKHAASEMRDLYDWWKNRRPKRMLAIDSIPDDECPSLFEGWTEDPKTKCLSFGSDERAENEAKYPRYYQALKISFDQEEKWYDEDTENLIRLAKIRGFLWT